MKRSASETIKNGYFNLERLSRFFFRLALAGNFESGTALFLTPNFLCAEPNAYIMITYFEAETEMY